MPKFTVLNDKLEVADFKYGNNLSLIFFFNCSIKTPKLDIFGPKVKDF